MDLLTLLQNFGLPVVMVIWFLRRDATRDKQIQDREARLTTRLESLEDHQRSTLETMAKDMIKVLAENTKALKDVYHIIHTCEAQRDTDRYYRRGDREHA